MSSNIHEVIIKLRDEATKQIENVKNASDGLVKSLEKNAEGFQTMQRVGATALTGLAALGGFAVKTASNMQDLRTSLNTLTGSAEKGKELFMQIQKEANTTPFDSKGLAQATSTMLGFGVAQEDVIKNLRMLGDISLGDANKLQSLSLVFGQIRAAGKLTGGDLLQLINVGFNPLEVISKKTGKSIAVLRDEMENGKITYDMVADAMKTATSEGGRFFRGMENSSKTFSGRMAALGDSVGVTLAALGGFANGEVIKGGLLDQLTQVIAKAQPYLDSISEWAGNNPELATKVLVFSVGIAGLVTALGTLGLAIPAIVNGFVAVKGALLVLSGPLGIIMVLVGALYYAWTNNLWGIQEKTQVAFAWIKNTIETTIANIKIFWDTHGEEIMRKTKETWNTVVSVIGTVLGGIKNAIEFVWNVIQDIWDTHGAGIMESARNLWTTVQEVWNIGMTFIIGVAQKLWEGIKYLWDTYGADIIAGVNIMWETVKIIFTLALDAIMIAVRFGLDLINGTINIFAGIFTGDWRRIWEGVKTIAVGVFNAIWSTIKSVFGAINEWIKDVFGVDLGAIFSTIWNGAKDIANGAIQAIDDFCRPILSGLVGFVNDLIGGIQTAFNKAKEVASYVKNKAGKDFVNNFSIQGVVGAISGARADGGPVTGGKTYLVGERGPELFTPPRSGNIVPNHELGGGSQSIAVNFGTVNVYNEADENRLVDKIKSVLYQESKYARLGY